MIATDEKLIQDQLRKVQASSRLLIKLSDAEIAKILHQLADLAEAETDFLLAANQQDLDRMDPADPKYDRLLLSPERIRGIAGDLRNVAALPSPLGITLDEGSLDSGLHVQRISVPLGVVGIIFESRPNVTFDVFALWLK